MIDHNDWRVTISLADPAHARRARQAFAERRVGQDVRARLGGAIAVGGGDGGGAKTFLYAGTEIAAREAERVARQDLAAEGVEADYALHRWHPVAEEWERPDSALPRTDAEIHAEHERLMDAEAAESRATGVAEWEVRAEFPSHHEALEMAQRLRGEGKIVVRRWRFLVIGATNEDEAAILADQVRKEAPADAAVRAEHTPAPLPFVAF